MTKEIRAISARSPWGLFMGHCVNGFVWVKVVPKRGQLNPCDFLLDGDIVLIFLSMFYKLHVDNRLIL